MVRQELEGADHDRIDLCRRPPVAAFDQVADLVHHDLPALGREDVDEGLRPEHLADRRRKRRPAALAPDLGQLVEHVVEAVRKPLRAEICVELGHQARRELVLGRPHRNPRREWRHGIVSERRVDQLAGTPEGGNLDAGVETDARERLRECLRGHAVDGERNRIDGAGNDVRLRSCSLDRGGKRRSCRSLAVETDRQTARLADPPDENARATRIEGAGRVVHQCPRSAELVQVMSALEEDVAFVPRAGAVHEPDCKLFPGAANGLGSVHEVFEVVQRVVDPENVDAALGSAVDEAPNEISRDGPRPDQEPPAKRNPERCLTPRFQSSDSLPGAFDPAAHGRVEAAAAGDLQVREPSTVEDVGELQEAGCLDTAREWLLRKEADRRVD